MSKARQQLWQAYQRLELYFQQATAGGAESALINDAEQLAAQFCHSGINLNLLFSQLSLTPVEFSYCSQLAMKQWVLLYTLSQQLKWPAACTENFLACALFRLSAIAANLPAAGAEQQQQLLSKAGLYRLKVSGATFSHRQWRQLLTDSSLPNGQKTAWQLLPHANAIQLCCQLAFAITPTQQRPAVGLEQALRQICLQSAYAQLQPLAWQLAAVGPALYLCGRFCSDSIGNLQLITTIQPELSGHLFDMSSKKLISQHQPITESSLKLLAPRRLPDQQWLDYFSHASQEEFPLLPPLDLLQLHQLDPNQSIRQQVHWLQQYPQYSDFLRKQASMLNRQQKTVSELLHAVALIGTERLPYLLKQAWLQQQIKVLAQPYRSWFAQWSHCLAQALLLLTSQQAALALNQAQAELLASCVSFTLQQDEPCRYLPLQAAGSKLSPLVHQCYQNCWQHAELPRQAAMLVTSMGLPALWQDAVLNFRHFTDVTPPFRPALQARLVLAFALQLTEALFYGVVARPQQSEQLYLQLCQALQLPAANWLQWLQRLSAASHCSWPLQPDL